MILFLDLETTGFDPQTDAILEIAAIITDDQLGCLGGYRRVIRFDSSMHLGAIDPVVVDMHTRNGLWSECLCSGYDIDAVDDEFQSWLHRCSKEPIYLAGNSIHFDRSFMGVSMPKTCALLHYRQIDLTSINEMARRFWPYVYAERPKQSGTHRAIPDAAESLACALYYSRALKDSVKP